ncbi:YhdP family protein [Thalassotalea aquiviva]|uniref:YhdP family protein n=1 Tax=Thalassotalea aquiviva TaxID=3242415 RepID=UPI00352A4552
MKTFVAYLNTWLSRLYKTLAVLLVLVAVLLSSVRIFLPYAHTYKQDVEDYLNQSYQGDIEIGELTAGWQNFGPTLVVNDLILTNSDAISVTVDEVDLGIDFWGSIQARQLKTSNVTLNGAHIILDQTLLWQHNDAKDPSSSTKQNPDAHTDINSVANLVLQQLQRFSLRNSTLQFKTVFKQHDFVIKKLAWLNEGVRHRGIGLIETLDNPDNSAKLVIDLTGTDLTDINGQIYLEGNGVDLASWIDKLLGEKGDRLDSEVNFKSWLQITDGRTDKVEVVFEQSQLSWNSFTRQDQLVLPTTQLTMYRQESGQGFFIQSTPITLNFNEQEWPKTQLQVMFAEDTVEARMQNLSLTHLWQLFPLVQQVFPQIKSYQGLDLKGNVADLRLRKHDGITQALLALEQVGINRVASLPGIDNVSAQLLWQDERALLAINARDSELNLGNHFSRPIPISSLKTQLLLDSQQPNWLLQVKELDFINNDLRLSGHGQYQYIDGQSDYLSISAVLNDADASKVQYYLPLTLMDQGLVNYLNNALKSGTLTQAGIIVDGPVQSFPYTDNAGMFVVDADLEQATFQFAEDWPAIEQMQANLNFTKNSMLISATGGTLMDIPLSDVAVGIAKLGKGSVLTVRTPIQTEIKKAEALMLASPLASSVGETMAFLDSTGAVNGTFSLDLPLSDTSNALAKGEFFFDNLKLNLQAPDMHFSQVAGSIRFENAKIKTNKLSLNWRGLPIGMQVSGNRKGDNYQVDVAMTAAWEKRHFIKEIPNKLQPYVDGIARWQGDLALKIPTQGELNYEVSIQSDLTDLSLNLPAPYQKNAQQSWQLRAKAWGNSKQSSIEAKVQDNLHFYGDLNHQSQSFSRANLILGNEEMFLPREGFYINTALKTVEFMPWWDLVNDIVGSIPESKDTSNDQVSEPLLSSPKRIRGTVAKVNFAGETFTDLQFSLLNQPQWWALQLNSEQIRTRAKFYHEFASKGLEVDADFIHLAQKTAQPKEQKNETEKQKTTVVEQEQVFNGDIDPADIPLIKFSCDSCTYQRLDFGALSFALKKSNDSQTLTVENIKAQRKDATIEATATWTKNGERHISTIEANLNSSDLEREVEALGFQSGIKDSGLKADGKLTWQGGLHQFNIASLNGEVSASLNDGYLADVSDQGARIFSLFSLQSLVRKLTLDFRDVFSKGMFYSDIKANFNVTDGIVYTDNMKMNAIAGNLKVKGNTNLVTSELDYKMSFAPKVTSSLPVIIGWLVNPLMGVAILAADEAIQKAEVISVINFELTGTIDKPNFKEVDRKSRDINVGKSKPDQKLNTDVKGEPNKKTNAAGVNRQQKAWSGASVDTELVSNSPTDLEPKTKSLQTTQNTQPKLQAAKPRAQILEPISSTSGQ